MSMQLVLNVDDSAANRYLKSRALRQAGFQVVEAGTGSEALALVHERRPDLVLLDIRLPDISGLDVARRLKADPDTETIPIVHISATFVDAAAKTDSIESGAAVYIAEPVGPAELASTLRTVLRLRDVERTVAQERERMRLLAEGAGIAAWDLSAEPRDTIWSDSFREMLGYRQGEVAPSLEAWLQRVRPDEREGAGTRLRGALEKGGSVAFEHWIERPDAESPSCIAVYGTSHSVSGRRLIGVAMDITQRKLAEAERERLLEQARSAQQAAEEAARMKDEFLAILSHELRTPMSAVLGWLQLARRGLPADQLAHALETVERNARLQTQLVNDLLDVSGIVTGKLSRDPIVAPLDAVLAGAVDSARPAAERRKQEISLRLAPGNWPVQGNPARLEQIFGNLLSNAMKFSPEGGRIEVELHPEGARARITVRDFGEGIALDTLPRIFDFFRQADSSSRRRHGGLGLGLAIAKSLVELHGGVLSVESEGRGHGAEFTVRLPLAERDAPAPDPSPARQHPLRGLRILSVDDEPDHREMLSRLMRLEGAEVASAGDADEALAAVAAWQPDVMVLDLAMPGVDGFELLQRLRERFPGIPAIALSGYAATRDVERAYSAGFDRHLAKPFEIERLRRAIVDLMERRAGPPSV